MQITHRTGTYYTETTPMLIWEAHEDGEMIGELYVTTDTHEIAQIEVNEDRRGEGIARSLYETAYADMGCIYHAYAAHRTEDGAAFAEAMGGEEIEECAVESCYCTAA